MHTFQPYPINLLEFNPFTKFSQEWAAIVTEANGKANAMTASWGSVGVLWGKNVACIYVRDSRYTKELLDNSDTFSINFFNDPKMKHTLSFLGKVSGRNEDKLTEARLHVDHELNTPFLDEADFVIICKKMAATRITEDAFLDPTIKDQWYADGDMHTMYIGEIKDVLAR
jgi:flavin reductase (DIM6/NTAB) family NADH-FMN oxidoreductase RutF